MLRRARCLGVLYAGLLGSLPLCASCAQPQFEELPPLAPVRCQRLSCGDFDGPVCQASSASLRLQLQEPLLDAGSSWGGELAILPMQIAENRGRCIHDRHCGSGERCARGRCWSSAWKRTELKRWFFFDEPVAGALEGVRAQLGESQTLEVEIPFAQERPGLFALFLGPRWQRVGGARAGESLVPLAFVWREGHALGAWGRQTPRWQPSLGVVQLACPLGWQYRAHWRGWAENATGELIELPPAHACQDHPVSPQSCIQWDLSREELDFFSVPFRLRVITSQGRSRSAAFTTAWSRVPFVSQ